MEHADFVIIRAELVEGGTPARLRTEAEGPVTSINPAPTTATMVRTRALAGLRHGYLSKSFTNTPTRKANALAIAVWKSASLGGISMTGLSDRSH